MFLFLRHKLVTMYRYYVFQQNLFVNFIQYLFVNFIQYFFVIVVVCFVYLSSLAKTFSSQLGDLGSGAGKGGGGGGSIREAGGSFGKMEAAREEEYFYKKVCNYTGLDYFFLAFTLEQTMFA